MLIATEALKAVIFTARYGSFSAAAERLHKVPTALSYTVHKLEAAMGVRLFARHGKSLELTDAGRYFIARGERILDELENLHDATRRIAAGIETELRVSLNNIVSQTPLLALLKESEARFPHTEIHLAIDVHDGVWDALQDNRADLAVGAPNQAQRGGGIACEEIGVVDWVFAISPVHPLAALRQPLDNDTLRPWPAVCIRDTSVRLPPKIAWQLHGQKALIAPDYPTKIRMHLAGLGIGFLPHHFCQPYLDRGELVALTVEEPKQPTPLFLAWPSQRHARPCFAWWLDKLRSASVRAGLFSPLTP